MPEEHLRHRDVKARMPSAIIKHRKPMKNMIRTVSPEVHFPCCCMKSRSTEAKEAREIPYAATVAELELTVP